jgi:hypothetical protein
VNHAQRWKVCDASIQPFAIEGITAMIASDPIAALRKRRVLSVGKLLAAALTYCAANARPLFVAVWFPSFLSTLCLIALAFALFSDPARAPQWLMSQGFDPRTWLSAIVAGPFSAMVIAFVLDRMAGAPEQGRVSFRRGMEDERIVRVPGISLDISSRILLASLPLIAVDLVFGFTLAGEHKILVANLMATDGSSAASIKLWTMSTWIFNRIAGGFVLAWTYLFVGDFIRTGSFDPARCWKVLAGNRLRFAVTMFLVFAGVLLLQAALVVAGVMIFVHDDVLTSFTSIVVWHFGLGWPFRLLHLVLSAATVGVVLDGFSTSPLSSPRRLG